MYKKNFNDKWTLLEGNFSTPATFLFMGGSGRDIHLPHDAMIHEERTPDTPNSQQTGFYPGGEYTYVKSFYAPDEWKEQTVLLEFEGVYQTAMVYINGDFVGKNLSGYSNFYICLDEYLRFGEENKVFVITQNIGPNSRWYSGSGIYRGVNLLVGNSIHIPENSLKIRTVYSDQKKAIVEIECRLKNISRQKEIVKLDCQLFHNGVSAGREKTKVTMFPMAEETVRQNICIQSPALWNCDTPNLYTSKIVVQGEEIVYDEVEENFGIRTVTLDAVNGLCINGKEVKLRGACIHHDNGVIGAVTLKAAEERRCRLLKEAGFNSIRSSHHPISKEMLDACDRYGILVMDELTDMWTYHKNPEDYALHFTEHWEEDVEKMVAKDYNHPSVVLYCSGNEIPEMGTQQGARLNRHICNRFHELDPDRFTTNGINGMMSASFGTDLMKIINDVMGEYSAEIPDVEKAEGQKGSDALNQYMSFMTGDGTEGADALDAFSCHPMVSEVIQESSEAGDVIGLNYLTARHILEKELHPNKTVLGTETYPADIVRLWDIVKNNPHVIGDFTWAGYDYLGEAGVGIFHYDGHVNFSSVYPERLAYIGDIDLVGYRRPISYYREIVYGLRQQPYIAVTRMDKKGQKPSKTAWMFKDNLASWTWPGYEGQKAVVDVYSDSEEVELFLNGKSLGRKYAGKDNKFTASYEVVYEPGMLEAFSYGKGEKLGKCVLTTAGESAILCAEPDKTVLKADGEDLAFIMVHLEDEKHNHNLFQKKRIAVAVEGAVTLQGYGSAAPSGMGSYDDTVWETHDGYVLAVIRAGEEEGKATIRFTADGCEESVVEIEVKEMTR